MTHFAASNLKRSAFRKRSVGRRVCEASSDRFSTDFQSVRARGDIRKTCKNQLFLQVFHKSSLLRARGPARAKERRKVSKLDPLDPPNRPKSLHKGDVGSLEASRQASRIDLGSLEVPWTRSRSRCWLARAAQRRSWLARVAQSRPSWCARFGQPRSVVA